jgi:ABC-type phosphate/phosphonate transport system substrate-binding protein
VFMCGWPYAKDPRGRHVLAVPVPSAEWARGQPVYRSDFVVSAAAPFATLSDCRGHRYAYTATDSHSGYNAPRASLAALGTGAALFGEVLGPYGTPRRAIEAVVAGEADVTGIDAYAYDLLCHHEPAFARATRVIAASPPYPMPPLVASAGTQPGVCRALTGALVGLADDPAGRDLLGDLRLRGFAEVAAGDYALTLAAGPAADAVGYTAIR